ncbi:hypothetical protein B0J13DRAFT_166994 [Dactylonectria estremocensis]|uniref:Uncharacterized protein n=1 Tax=Dactylonectria estremocensis TaxID=1079267 RepID=A0A9P9DGJ2_9HYPO|nr:hypothetical protein B0J13DRAFT_166994 [Dactylonectria estremocensis]
MNDNHVLQELTELLTLGPCRRVDQLFLHNDDSSRNSDDLSRGDDDLSRSDDDVPCGAVVLWDMLEATKAYHRDIWTTQWMGEREFIRKSIEDMELSLAKYLTRFSRSMANESCPGFHWLQYRHDAGQRASNPDPKILSSMNENVDQWYMQTACGKCHASAKLQDALRSHLGCQLDLSLNLTLNTLSKRQFTALALHHNLKTLIIVMHSLGCESGVAWGEKVLTYAGKRIDAAVAGKTVT